MLVLKSVQLHAWGVHALCTFNTSLGGTSGRGEVNMIAPLGVDICGCVSCSILYVHVCVMVLQYSREEVIVPGPLVMFSAISNSLPDFGEPLFHSIDQCTHINKFNPVREGSCVFLQVVCMFVPCPLFVHLYV